MLLNGMSMLYLGNFLHVQHVCKKVLGAARNLQGAGSLTVLGGITIHPYGLDLAHHLQAVIDAQIDVSLPSLF